MGYTLAIGELVLSEVSPKSTDTIPFYVETVELDFAPAFGEPTDYTNRRLPSYSGWAEAMSFVGLHDFMFNQKTGLIKEHFDFVQLTAQHKAIIDKAHQDFYIKYPNAKAGYSPKAKEDIQFYQDHDWPEENRYAVRLEWLKFWVDWALKNCEVPVFFNY